MAGHDDPLHSQNNPDLLQDPANNRRRLPLAVKKTVICKLVLPGERGAASVTNSTRMPTSPQKNLPQGMQRKLNMLLQIWKTHTDIHSCLLEYKTAVEMQV
jgi:hypothetical protein